MADPNPNPSSEEPAAGGASKPASPAPAASSGEPTDGATLNELAEAKARTLMQGNMDKNIALMGNGRYTEMDPKVLELLESYEKQIQTNRPAAEPTVAEAKRENPYEDILFPGGKKPADPKVPTPLEEKGKEAIRQETVAKLEEQIADRWVKAAWRKDAEAFFRDIGEIEGFDKEDFALVDLTNAEEFPINGDGYKKWLNNASLLRAKYLNDGGTPVKKESGDGGSSEPNAVDRARAKRTKRQPGANSSATAANTLLEAAKQRHEGKMTDADFREQIKKRIPRGGRVIA